MSQLQKVTLKTRQEKELWIGVLNDHMSYGLVVAAGKADDVLREFQSRLPDGAGDDACLVDEADNGPARQYTAKTPLKAATERLRHCGSYGTDWPALLQGESTDPQMRADVALVVREYLRLTEEKQ